MRAEKYYVGCTSDLKKRLNEHNRGIVESSRKYLPWKLAYYEAFSQENRAWARESRLKNNGNALIELKKRAGVYKKSDKGFTLVEMLVVIGLVVVVAGFSVVVGLDSFRGDSFRAERDTIVILLQQARTESLNNINESRHGVVFFPAAHPNSYVEFEGTSYTAPGHDPNKDTVVDAQYPVSFAASAPAEIIFDQLTGNSSFSGTFGLIDGQRQITSNISITSEGGISW